MENARRSTGEGMQRFAAGPPVARRGTAGKAGAVRLATPTRNSPANEASRSEVTCWRKNIEPSDIERGELPEKSAAYMTYLETENEALREEVLRLELENKRLNGISLTNPTNQVNLGKVKSKPTVCTNKDGQCGRSWCNCTANDPALPPQRSGGRQQQIVGNSGDQT